MKIRHEGKDFIYDCLLGKGGCGVVCKYIEPVSKKKIAVKFETLTGRQVSMSPLTQEEMNMNNLWKRNPKLKHVPRFLGHHILPQDHLKFEYLETGLEAYLKQKIERARDKKILVDVSLQMLEALKEMHLLNYVHRDVKTDNFMVDKDVVKIIDFGLTYEFLKNKVHTVHQSIGGF